MKTTTQKLPAKSLRAWYRFRKTPFYGIETTSGGGDNTNTCTTVVTTTHLNKLDC
jgi:hypothetical protein